MSLAEKLAARHVRAISTEEILRRRVAPARRKLQTGWDEETYRELLNILPRFPGQNPVSTAIQETLEAADTRVVQEVLQPALDKVRNTGYFTDDELTEFEELGDDYKISERIQEFIRSATDSLYESQEARQEAIQEFIQGEEGAASGIAEDMDETVSEYLPDSFDDADWNVSIRNDYQEEKLVEKFLAQTGVDAGEFATVLMDQDQETVERYLTADTRSRRANEISLWSGKGGGGETEVGLDNLLSEVNRRETLERPAPNPPYTTEELKDALKAVGVAVYSGYVTLGGGEEYYISLGFDSEDLDTLQPLFEKLGYEGPRYSEWAETATVSPPLARWLEPI